MIFDAKTSTRLHRNDEYNYMGGVIHQVQSPQARHPSERQTLWGKQEPWGRQPVRMSLAGVMRKAARHHGNGRRYEEGCQVPWGCQQALWETAGIMRKAGLPWWRHILCQNLTQWLVLCSTMVTEEEKNAWLLYMSIWYQLIRKWNRKYLN